MNKVMIFFLLLFLSCIKTINFPEASAADTAKSGDNQIGLVSEALPDSLTVRITNSGTGNPIEGLTINFTITQEPDGAGSSLSASSDVTDSDGVAGAIFTLGSILGDYRVEFIANGDTINFISQAMTKKTGAITLNRRMNKLIRENTDAVVAHQDGFHHDVRINGNIYNVGGTATAQQKTDLLVDFVANNILLSKYALRINDLLE